MNTIDTFSFIRIILLDKHPIYRDGRKFASYRWGINPNSHIESDVEKCLKESRNLKNGELPHRAYTALEEKKDFKVPLKQSFQQNDLK